MTDPAYRKEFYDEQRRTQTQHLNSFCQFRKKPTVGDIVMGRWFPIEKNAALQTRDHQHVEECNRVRVEPFGYVTLKSGLPFKARLRTYRITEVSDWWQENRPINEPDYSI